MNDALKILYKVRWLAGCREAPFMKMAPKTKKNFTSSQTELLLSEIDQQKHRLLLFSVNGGIKGSEKDKEWGKMTCAVNAVSAVAPSQK